MLLNKVWSVGPMTSMLARFQQGLEGAHLEGQVLHPSGRVAVAVHFGLARQLEKRQYVAVARIQKNVHVRIGRLGRGHLVFGYGQHETHAQVLFVPLHRLFGVLAAVGHVVNLLDR
jgi:hypothetical protein